MLTTLRRQEQRARETSADLAAMLTPPSAGIGRLGVLELEELLIAVEDRAEVCPADRTPLLARGRIALELELADRLRA